MSTLPPPNFLGSSPKKNTVCKDWEPHPGRQTDVLSRLEREIFTGDGRGGGKTDIGLAWLAEPEYTEHPAFRSLVMRENAKDMTDWIFRARKFFHGLAEIKGNPPKIYWSAGGITDIGHWKDADSVGMYIGQEFNKILVEEITKCIARTTDYEMLLGSLRSSTPELGEQLMCNGNPGGRGHSFVKSYFVDKCRLSPCCGAPVRQAAGKVYFCHVCDKECVPVYKVYVDPDTRSSRVFIPLGYKDNPTLQTNSPRYYAWLMGLQGTLGEAWREGNWEAFKGQFFANFGAHLKEPAGKLEPHKHAERVFGSFDYGCGANGVSSFGFWYVDENEVPHRCFTHTSRGLIPPSEQAETLAEYIASFGPTGGLFPRIIWYDNSMDSRAGLRGDEWATIDYFKAVFDKHYVRMMPANKNRVNGWQCMIDYFSVDPATGLPKMRYWEEYNDDFVNSIPDLVSDPNHPDDVEKCDQDHWADECRYGLVGIRTRTALLVSQRSGMSVGKMNAILTRLGNAGRLGDTGLN